MSHFEPTYNIGGRGERSPIAKGSYSPGHWKSYLVKDFHSKNPDSRIIRDRASQRPSNHGSQISQLSYHPRVSDIVDEKQKKKEDMMKRVKEIQKRVMPLIENDQNNGLCQEVSGRNRLQQKVSKLETAIDAIRKQMDIKVEKRLLQLEKTFAQRIEMLQERLNR